MTLVDKINELNVGDLVQLQSPSKPDRIGFVLDYSSKTIKLSNTNTRDKEGRIRRPNWFMRQFRNERYATLPLEPYDNFAVLKKYKELYEK